MNLDRRGCVGYVCEGECFVLKTRAKNVIYWDKPVLVRSQPLPSNDKHEHVINMGNGKTLRNY